MARIELRDATILLKDGLAGTALIDDVTPPVAGDTAITISDVDLNAAVTDQVPIGARVTVAGETASQVHVVTARTPASGTTTEITLSPALGAGTYLDEGVLTFLPQELEIKVGDGNVSYTETKNYDYMLDRGNLDTVREGDEAPMDVRLECVYEHITTGTSESIAPIDALKAKNGAAEWVSSSSDLCEPYSVDMVIEHETPCGTAQNERTTFPDFRHETLEVNLRDATISVTGKCNVTEPIVERY